ncbi:hypothetical protein BgiMline_026624 [Biomphalaria glabrata]|nr:hypothetical protein BgiMline_021088 [Biomphalaria glabrata]
MKTMCIITPTVEILIISTASQYTICTESVDKRDVPVDTYGNNLIERIVSPEITTNKTVLSKGDRDDEKDESETDRNDLNFPATNRKWLL